MALLKCYSLVHIIFLKLMFMPGNGIIMIYDVLIRLHGKFGLGYMFFIFGHFESFCLELQLLSSGNRCSFNNSVTRHLYLCL